MRLTFTTIIIISVLMMANVAAGAFTIFGEPVDCDPSKPVTITIKEGGVDKRVPGGGCGLPHLIQAIRYVIEFMLKIVFPIGAVMVIWGGFTIMTAAGSEEKVKKGRQIITWAVAGIAIALASYLIIALLNNIISDKSYKFQGSGFNINTNE